MYFDEDGDLAHEFYEEAVVTKNGQRKAKLKRIYKNLTPQVRMHNPSTLPHLSKCFCSLHLNLFPVPLGNHKAGSPLYPCRFSSCAL